MNTRKPKPLSAYARQNQKIQDEFLKRAKRPDLTNPWYNDPARGGRRAAV